MTQISAPCNTELSDIDDECTDDECEPLCMVPVGVPTPESPLQTPRMCHQNVLHVWEPCTSAELPNGRFGHTAVIRNNDMWVFGGRDNEFRNDLWRYSLSAGSWTAVEVTSRPRPRAGHTCVLFGDAMHVFGGALAMDQCSQDHWAYVFSTNEWKLIMPFSVSVPSPRRGHTAVLFQRRWMIVFGGSAEVFADGRVWMYDLLNNTWVDLPCTGNCPKPRMYHVAEIDDDLGNMYVFGGRGIDNFFNDLCVLNIATGVWHEVRCGGTVPPIRMCASSFFRNGALCIFQGGSTEYYDDAFEFDVQTCSWRPIATNKNSTKGRTRPTTVLHNNRIVMFGGCTQEAFSNDLSEMELEPPSLKELCRLWLRASVRRCPVIMRAALQKLPRHLVQYLESDE